MSRSTNSERAQPLRRLLTVIRAVIGQLPESVGGHRRNVLERAEALVAFSERAADEHLEVGRGEAGLERPKWSAIGRADAHAKLDVVRAQLALRAYSSD